MWADYARALFGGALLFGIYFLLAFIRPGGMGMGDVKLAAPLGTALTWFGWSTWAIGAFLGFLVGSVAMIALMAAGRVDRHTKVPFGPAMLMGAWIAILLGAL